MEMEVDVGWTSMLVAVDVLDVGWTSMLVAVEVVDVNQVHYECCKIAGVTALR